MELIKVGEKTYYIKNNTNIGIYKLDEQNIYLIDTGNDKEAGKKILKIIAEQNWNIKGIINTHSNADHIGGNKVIQDRTSCKIYTSKVEKAITENPTLEPPLLYGGFPFKSLHTKFLEAKESIVELLNDLPAGLEVHELPGHYFEQIGIKTSDNVIFLGDSLFSEETIEKYHIFFIYDVAAYLKTLDYLDTLEAALYIPSHVEATTSIKDLIKLNREKIFEVINTILTYCNTKHTFEEILQYIFTKYNLTMNEAQYVLIGSTIKSYLSYLSDSDKLVYTFVDNKMYWQLA